MLVVIIVFLLSNCWCTFSHADPSSSPSHRNLYFFGFHHYHCPFCNAVSFHLFVSFIFSSLDHRHCRSTFFHALSFLPSSTPDLVSISPSMLTFSGIVLVYFVHILPFCSLRDNDDDGQKLGEMIFLIFKSLIFMFFTSLSPPRPAPCQIHFLGRDHHLRRRQQNTFFSPPPHPPSLHDTFLILKDFLFR